MTPLTNRRKPCYVRHLACHLPRDTFRTSLGMSISQKNHNSPPNPPVAFTKSLKERARELGFALCGVCPAVTPGGLHHLAQWLDAGYAGEMTFLEEYAHAHEHPRYVLDGARSLLLLAMNYHAPQHHAPYYREEAGHVLEPGHGRVASYARGTDYHDVIHGRLRELKDWFHAQHPAAAVRGVVDSAPIMEREFAQLAGLGWIGKNTLLLNRQQGSWFFLSVLLTDVVLDYDAATEVDHCGTCTACLDACPTDAFPSPYVVDARKCISYLTIEHRTQIPKELRAGMGDWLFGCDVCQEVCPWNNHAPEATENSFRQHIAGDHIDLCELLTLDETEFRRRFRRTPLWRPKRRGLLRNAAIVLGNQRHRPALPALGQALSDEESIIRGAAAWALGQIGGEQALLALRGRNTVETDPDVCDEIAAAIAQCDQSSRLTAD